MPFCPHCRYEYLPEITTCPECEAALVEELPPRQDIAPDVEWVPLRPLPGMIYAKMVAEVLDQHDIPNYIQSLYGSGGLGVISGDDFPGADARLWVPEPFLQEANAILDDMMKDV